VNEPFEWNGRRFGKGEWVVLDIYGTNRDPERWREPEAFRPERFVDREIDPWEMIPQGGGDFVHDHRCPGEWITIALLKEAVSALVMADWTVPDQDLSVDLSRMPALPASGLVLDRWRTVAEAPRAAA
jgi:fatty-acid peroxygenase